MELMSQQSYKSVPTGLEYQALMTFQLQGTDDSHNAGNDFEEGGKSIKK
jgi:hypothetical protein